MISERFYKGQETEEENNFLNCFLPIDNGSRKRPRIISVINLGNSIKLQLENEKFADRNVSSLQFQKQDIEVDAMPEPSCLVEKSYIAISENYLYVWIPSLNRWKRTILSSW